ncbi:MULTISPECIES: hypothetical protein [Pseudomonas]|nr:MULTISPECIES: hypothetical protein [Pseudomonas]MBP1087009.1 hypothetical protein [Pseudomonas sp. PvP007]MBP1197158.1 hypothetical protein [Pseudomonas sp. PvP100]MBS7416966.1 hypothetical protein [Pseudomonas syringae]MCH5521541.1 hypothetical protein [Pseudomonas syringae pv. lapsa]UZS69613.1 hypothetical protein OQB65_09865 [Pseudomonas syringae]
MVYAQLSDDGETVVAVFSCAQDETDYPNQAQLQDTDERYLQFKRNSEAN